MPAVEFIATIVAIGIAALVLPLAGGLKRPLRRGKGFLAKHPKLAVVSVGILSLSINAGLTLFVYKPLPSVHDEFSYLLAADTFASGRLTNPPHPMWEHFQTHHVIFQPTYQSKYPPLQGVFLAFGQVLFGEPIVGTWLSLCLATSAVCWMLQAWVPPHWSFLGGLVTAVNPRIVLHWGQSYWGGAVAMLGGALVFGALIRIVRSATWKDAGLLGVGLVILANTRPFEGLVASLPAAAVLAGWMFGKGKSTWKTRFSSVLLPLLAVLAAGGAAMAYYNWRVTGNPMTMPYAVWLRDHGLNTAEVLVSTVNSSAAAPVIADKLTLPGSSPEMAEQLARRTSVLTDPKAIIAKPLLAIYFYSGLSLGAALLFLPCVGCRRRGLLAVLTIGALFLASSFNTAPGHAHYFAPVAAILIYAIIQGLRQILQLKCIRLRHCIVFGLCAGYITAAAFAFYDHANNPLRRSPAWARERHAFVSRLKRCTDSFLVFVRYGPHDSWHDEWVYNRADINASKIVFARDLGHSSNRELIEFFPDRTPLLLTASKSHGRRKCVLYPISGCDDAPERPH